MLGDDRAGCSCFIGCSQLKCLFDGDTRQRPPKIFMEPFIRSKPPGAARSMGAHESEVDMKVFRKIPGELHLLVTIVPFEKNVFPFDSKPRANARSVVAQLAQEIHYTLEAASDPIPNIA